MSIIAATEIFRSKSTFPTKGSWLIKAGFVKMGSWDPSGKYVVVGFAGPGDTVTPKALEFSAVEAISMTVVEAKQVEQTPKQDMDQLRNCIQIMMLQRSLHCHERVFNAMKWLSECYYPYEASGAIFSLRKFGFTQELFGELCNCNRVSVTRSLRELREMGAILRIEEGVFRLNPAFSFQ